MAGPGARYLRLRHRLPSGLLATGLLFSPLAVAPESTPSVSLDTLLAPPPSAGYSTDTESLGTPIGSFGAGDYAGYVQESDPSSTNLQLMRDGFVDGYGASWTEGTTGRALIELVVAFSGGQGARQWLSSARQAAKSSAFFKHDLQVPGIGPFFGVHYADPSRPSYADAVSFVKGNDFFTVGFVSTSDDLGNAAAAQAKKQFDMAPSDSIPPAQWPENLNLLAGGLAAVRHALAAAVALVVIGFAAALGLFIYVRRHENGSGGAKLSLDGEQKEPPGG